MKKKQRYLVAMDGSEWSERAAARAVLLAGQTGARVILATVIPWSGYMPVGVEGMYIRPLEKKEEEENARNEVFGPVLEKSKDSGVDISTQIHWGHPVPVLAGIAKKEKASYVFVGRRGRSRVADLVLGSVANALAHSLGVPIVLVP